MEYPQQWIDLRRQDIEPEMFTIALAVRYIRGLINHGGSDMRRPDLESAWHPEHLESFLARAVETTWKDVRWAQEWHKLQQLLLWASEAWEKGQKLFQEDLERAKSDQENMEYFSMVDFAVDCYAYVSASRVYADNAILRDWVINGDMLLWRQQFPIKRRSSRVAFRLARAIMTFTLVLLAWPGMYKDSAIKGNRSVEVQEF